MVVLRVSLASHEDVLRASSRFPPPRYSCFALSLQEPNVFVLSLTLLAFQSVVEIISPLKFEPFDYVPFLSSTILLLWILRQPRTVSDKSDVTKNKYVQQKQKIQLLFRNISLKPFFQGLACTRDVIVWLTGVWRNTRDTHVLHIALLAPMSAPYIACCEGYSRSNAYFVECFCFSGSCTWSEILLQFEPWLSSSNYQWLSCLCSHWGLYHYIR